MDAQPKTPSDEDDQRDESTFENQESMVHFVQGTIYGLPKEWVVEERPRTSLKYYGKIDQVLITIYLISFNNISSLRLCLEVRRGREKDGDEMGEGW